MADTLLPWAVGYATVSRQVSGGGTTPTVLATPNPKRWSITFTTSGGGNVVILPDNVASGAGGISIGSSQPPLILTVQTHPGMVSQGFSASIGIGGIVFVVECVLQEG